MPLPDRASTSKTKKVSAFLVTALMVFSVLAGLGALVGPAGATHDDPADQERLQFAHLPFANALDEKGIYVNEFDPASIGTQDVTESKLRVYGQDDQYPPDTYLDRNTQDAPTKRDIDDPWQPDVIPKDSVTFNPAIIRHGDEDFTDFSQGDFGWLTGCGADANLKKHLRTWYEPNSEYLGPRTDEIADDADSTLGRLDGEEALFDPPSAADTLVVESTYNVVDFASYDPVPLCEQDMLPFPTEGNFAVIPDDNPADSCPCGVQLDDPAHYQPGLDTMQAVQIADIEADQDTDSDGDLDELAKVRLERTIHLTLGDEVQFMDRVYQFRGTGEDPEGDTAALFRTWYAGNNFLDAPKDHAIVQAAHPNPDDSNWFFDRHSNIFEDAEHDVPKFMRTSYMRISFFQPDSNEVQITVGKEIQTGDVYYVDGVRQEIALVSATDPDGVADTGDEEMTSLTIRTPLPKSAPDGSWTSVPNDQIEFRDREEFVGPTGGESWQLVDSSVVTTQWITEVNFTDPIPLNPPFNHGNYSQVDDIDVQRWEQHEDNTKPNFPFGEENTVNGQPLFPLGMDYLTRAEPTNCGTPPSSDVANYCDWFQYFSDPAESDLADQIDSMRTHDDELTQRRIEAVFGINAGAWIDWVTHDSNETNLYYVKEWCDGRFSTSLSQVLEVQAGDDEFTELEINSHPCQYTELALPDRANTVSEVMAFLEKRQPYPDEGDYRLLGGDYLLHSSLKLQDDTTRYAFVYDPLDVADRSSPNGSDQLDVYVNPQDILRDSDSTVRLYSKDLQALTSGQTKEDFVPPHPYPDTEAGAEAPYDPNAIPGDSATFNPAIITHTAPDFTDHVGTFSWIQSCDGDAHLKKHLRVWYEKGHEYEGVRSDSGAYDPPTQADVIQVESTYRMVDAASFDPVTMCAGEAQLPFPTEGTNANLPFNPAENCGPASPLFLGGHNQPGLETMQPVDVARTFGAATVHGGVDLERSVTLNAPGDATPGGAVQMLDRVIQYKGVGEDGDGNTVALFKTWYAGNTDLTKPNCIELTGSERLYMNSAGQVIQDTQRPDAQHAAYIELSFFSDFNARVTIGQEIHAGDTFYTDGVRYDVPSVRMEGQELDSITLRTPLPKSDPFPLDGVTNSDQVPCGNWTTVPESQADMLKRETLQFGQCQVEDGSVVSSQWLVNICPECPIPVDPPFNQPYQQIDDTDAQLWKQGVMNTKPNFPFGEVNPVLGEGNGMPLFPDGHNYLTRERVQCNPFPTNTQDAMFCEWIDYYDVESTSFAELRNRLGALAGETAINPAASWDVVGLPVADGNFAYLNEWCDDRYNSVILQILNEFGTEYTELQVDSEPCTYTEFALPDRTNPASLLSGVAIPAAENLALPALSDLLGGDYLVSSSLHLEDEGNPTAGSTAPAFDAYDTNENCEIETSPELLNAIKDWLRPGSTNPADPDFNPKKIPTFGGPPSLFNTASHWLDGVYC